MMKATRAAFVPATGAVYAANDRTGEELRAVDVTVAGLDVIAGDDVRVRANGDGVEVEPLTDHHLLLRRVERGSGGAILRVRTEFEPAGDVEVGGVKEGEPLRFRERPEA